MEAGRSSKTLNGGNWPLKRLIQCHKRAKRRDLRGEQPKTAAHAKRNARSEPTESVGCYSGAGTGIRDRVQNVFGAGLCSYAGNVER